MEKMRKTNEKNFMKIPEKSTWLWKRNQKQLQNNFLQNLSYFQIISSIYLWASTNNKLGKLEKRAKAPKLSLFWPWFLVEISFLGQKTTAYAFRLSMKKSLNWKNTYLLTSFPFATNYSRHWQTLFLSYSYILSW